MPTVDDMLRYCRSELADRCTSTHHASSAALSRHHTPTCRWQVSTVSDDELQPTWVSRLILITQIGMYSATLPPQTVPFYSTDGQWQF